MRTGGSTDGELPERVGAEILCGLRARTGAGSTTWDTSCSRGATGLRADGRARCW